MASTKMDHKNAAAALPASTGSSSYRNDPDGISLRTTRSDYEYDDVPDLPSYDDAVSADDETDALNRSSQPLDEYRVINAPSQNVWPRRTAQNDCPAPRKAIGQETTIRMDPHLQDSTQLYLYITQVLRNIAPGLFVRVQGWHYETRRDKNNKKERQREYDFDIVLGMQKYFTSNADPRWSVAYTIENSDKAFRGSFRKTRAPGYKQDIEVGTDDKPDLKAWCEDYAKNKGALKCFRVSREVTGWDTEFLKDHLMPIIRSTHYRGHVDITFPVADKNVDIYTPHWVNQARLSWVRWIFYLTFLWILTWPVLYFWTKWWTVFKVNWHYSILRPGSDREYMSLSESAWLQKHTNLIRSLVLDKFKGDASDLPTDVQVDLNRRRSGLNMPATGNNNVDAAVNFIQGGVSAWNTLNGRGDSGGWGADS